MKKLKWLALCVVVSMCVVACGSKNTSSDNESTTVESTEEETVIYKLGDTVSTDLVDFTLNDAYLCCYAKSTMYSNENILRYAQATDTASGIYKASMGHVLVPVTYTIKNKDRVDLDVGDSYSSGGWQLKFKVQYDGEEYDLNGYDLNEKDGRQDGLHLDWGVISSSNGESYASVSTSNHWQAPGTLMYKTVGISAFDPTALDDPFKVVVNVINSKGEYEYFTYAVE